MERRIRVITKEMNGEAAYEGILHTFNKAAGEIVLSRVTCGNGQKLHSLQHFFKREIIAIQEIGDLNPTTAEEIKTSVNPTGLNINAKVFEAPPKSLPENRIITHPEARRDPSDDGVALINRRPVEPEIYLSGLSGKKEGSVAALHEPPKLTYIDKVEIEYENAIEEISSQRVIGIAAEGCNISRFGSVSLFIVGCRSYTYVFDVNILGSDCFTKGLGAILGNEDILKVIHDCRPLSDYLFHLQLVVLRNIFDTQVAHAIITKNDKGELPFSVISLVPCFYEYLNLSTKRCQFENVIRDFVVNDRLIWNKRPLPANLLCAAAEQVVYLRELRLAQMERLMSEFIFGVDIYLSCIRDATDKGIGQMGNLNRLPKQFQKLPAYNKERIARHRWKDHSSKIEKHNEVSNERIDGVWTEGNAFSTSYEKIHGKVVEYAGQNPSFDSLHLAPVKRHVSPKVSPITERKNISLPKAREEKSYFQANKSNGKQTNDDFPPLSTNSRPAAKKGKQKAEQDTQQVLKFDSPPEPDKPLGRGKIRDYYLQMANDVKPGAKPTQIQFDGKGRQSLPIPDDDELLASSYVVDVDPNSHVFGEEVFIKKRPSPRNDV